MRVQKNSVFLITAIVFVLFAVLIGSLVYIEMRKESLQDRVERQNHEIEFLKERPIVVPSDSKFYQKLVTLYKENDKVKNIYFHTTFHCSNSFYREKDCQANYSVEIKSSEGHTIRYDGTDVSSVVEKVIKSY